MVLRTRFVSRALLVTEEAFCRLSPSITKDHHEDIVESGFSGRVDRCHPGVTGCRPRNEGLSEVCPQHRNGKMQRSKMRGEMRAQEAHEEGEVRRQKMCPEMRT